MASRRMMLGYALVAPVVIWRLATSIYPFFYTAYLSFFDNSPVRRTHTFVGLANYAAMLRDTSVTDTLAFTVFFTVISVGLQIVLALACAELLNRQFPFRSFARAINLLPWAISGIVTGVTATWVFNQDYGLARREIRDVVVLGRLPRGYADQQGFLERPGIRVPSAERPGKRTDHDRLLGVGDQRVFSETGARAAMGGVYGAPGDHEAPDATRTRTGAHVAVGR
jgi:hypothetical protein